LRDRQVESEALDDDSRAELDLLRSQEQKLRAMLFGSGQMPRP
jgi:hypothetical protein